VAESIRTDRHRDLEGRGRDPTVRRALLALLCVVPVLALIGRFGQRDITSHAQARAADLTVAAPTHVRGGLFYQTKITVLAHRQLSQPKLVFGQGFLDGLTVNTIEPAASQELSRDGDLVLEYGVIRAGRRLTVWVQYQVNPTTVTSRTQRLELDDGNQPLVTLDRSFTSFP
jgi:hypothetical protein